jgi:glycosyltransferase involved in cell wall biosynthesis
MKAEHQNVVLIGPITCDKAESVGIVNESIINGLGEEYAFVPHIATRAKGMSRQGDFNATNIFYFIKHFIVWLICLIRTKPDIAHYAITSHWNLEKSLMLLRIAGFLGAKTVGHLHGGLFLEYFRSLQGWRKKWILSQLENLDALVVLSEGWREAVIKEVGLAQSKLFVVNNPLNWEFEQVALRMPVDRETVNVLCFGVIDRKKGVLDILQAAKQLGVDCQVNFQLVGTEREPGVFNEIAAVMKQGDLNSRTSLMGPVFDEAKIKIFREAAVFLLPSYAENFPLVVLEAAAAGLPIITTRVGATPEFFEHDVSALFIDTGSPLQIAEAIRSLLNSPVRRRELGLAARQVFTSRLQREHIMASMARVYDSVAGRSDSAADEVSAPAGVVRAATPEAPLQRS